MSISKNKRYFNRKLQEADEIQNDKGGSNVSQETNVDDNSHTKPNTTDTADLVKQVSDELNYKTKLKTLYNTELKRINDQIALLQKDKSDIYAIDNQNDEQAKSNKEKITELNKKINILLADKLAKKKVYQENIIKSENRILNFNTTIADNGGDVDTKCIDEFYVSRIRFSRKLYESVLNKTDEMFAIINMAFDNMDNLSYMPDKTRMRTFAKNTIAFLNNLGWGSDNHEDEFKEFLLHWLNASHISLAKSEKEIFVNNILTLSKDNPLFMWIFNQSK